MRLAVLLYTIEMHKLALYWELVEGTEKLELVIELRRLEALYWAVKYG